MPGSRLKEADGAHEAKSTAPGASPPSGLRRAVGTAYAEWRLGVGMPLLRSVREQRYASGALRVSPAWRRDPAPARSPAAATSLRAKRKAAATPRPSHGARTSIAKRAGTRRGCDSRVHGASQEGRPANPKTHPAFALATASMRHNPGTTIRLVTVTKSRAKCRQPVCSGLSVHRKRGAGARMREQ